MTNPPSLLLDFVVCMTEPWSGQFRRCIDGGHCNGRFQAVNRL